MSIDPVVLESIRNIQIIQRQIHNEDLNVIIVEMTMQKDLYKSFCIDIICTGNFCLKDILRQKKSLFNFTIKKAHFAELLTV